MKNTIFCLPILLATLMFITSCGGGTDPKFGSLTGAVALINDSGDPSNDPVDYSGITVALYEAVALDTVIVRINMEHPNIGLPISQETEFDHRLHTPVVSAQTDGTGAFKFSKLRTGKYILVYHKEGWGLRYCYNVM